MQEERNPAPEPEPINPTAAPPQPEPEPAAAPAQAQPEPDLLRAEVHRFNPEQQESARAALSTMILKSVAKMPALRTLDVARAVDMIEHDQGCSTPAENFVTGLLAAHYLFGGITPETVVRELDPENIDGFRVNFGDAIEVAKRLNATYPELTNRHQGEPKPDAINQAATHRRAPAILKQDEPELHHTAPAEPPAPAELPEWLDETPILADSPFHLIVEGADEWLQEIDLTRDEYIELKRHLAVMRGHIAQELDKAKLPAEVVCVDKTEWDLIVRAYEDLRKIVDGLPLDKKAA